MISKRDLEDLEVDLPSREQQVRVARVFRLATKEQTLMSAIKRCRGLYIQGMLMRIVSESRPSANDEISAPVLSYSDHIHPAQQIDAMRQTKGAQHAQ